MPKVTGKNKDALYPTKSSSRLKAKAQAKEMEEAISAMEQIRDTDFDIESDASETEETPKNTSTEPALEEANGDSNPSPLQKEDDVMQANDKGKEVIDHVVNLLKGINEGASMGEALVLTEPQTQQGGSVSDLYVAALGKTFTWKDTETSNTKSFASLFKDNREPEKGMKLRYIEPVGDYVDFSMGVMKSMVEIWGHCLVGYFAGRYLGFKPIQELVSK
ncbi:unnamed protein product [Cuscuta europaea]|uniref:Uncharacterized protein n=1 Tax=Cuscuta europaea TaxID=41803 RepID=A0A9P1ELS4_CUSEU|nr:unnamed protein product [Cuscuta europaea]